MENLQIGIERDNKQVVGYNINSEIINGLYSTTEKLKVEENIKNFDIIIEKQEDIVATKMSKRDNVVIITILIDDENKSQYLIGKDLNLDEFKNLNEFPSQLKPLILEAYNLTKVTSINDLLG
jgi:predicted transcriptional regulator